MHERELTVDVIKERLPNLEDKVAENTKSEQEQEKNLNEYSLRGLWDNIKQSFHRVQAG